MNSLTAAQSREAAHTQNVIAGVLSTVIPGLGQLYKGHIGAGILWIAFLPLAIWIGILLGLATAGLGLVIPILWWAAAAADAYYESDRRRHHRFAEPTIYEDVD
jgi:TM2 domain-containing membrane protein YozV